MSVHRTRKHIHKYRLVPMNASQKVWSCALPDCNHYMPPNMQHMIEGKASECWNCGKTTTMSTDRMLFAISRNEGKILCQDCMLRHEGTFIEPDPEDFVPTMDDIVAEYAKKHIK